MRRYVCPMGCLPAGKAGIEPQDQPGNCSECGMKLIEIEEKHKNHEDHDKHAGHKAEDFLKKFWLSLILTLIVIFLTLAPYRAIVWYGAYLSIISASIVFFYGGSVFIIGALREIKAKNPGMMTLIALAISSAYLYSLFVTISALIRVPIYPRLSAEGFWWELTSLITIMLLGHYFEMKSVSSAQRALKEIEKLLPDKAEVIAADESLSTRINDRIIIYPNINRIIISTRMTTGYSVKIRVINSV